MAGVMKENLDALKFAMKDDPDYAWAWHCNVAMPIKDSIGCSHKDANVAAARVMQHLFEVDITKMKEYQAVIENN